MVSAMSKVKEWKWSTLSFQSSSQIVCMFAHHNTINHFMTLVYNTLIFQVTSIGILNKSVKKMYPSPIPAVFYDAFQLSPDRRGGGKIKMNTCYGFSSLIFYYKKEIV